jgi:hypothetical protein
VRDRGDVGAEEKIRFTSSILLLIDQVERDLRPRVPCRTAQAGVFRD